MEKHIRRPSVEENHEYYTKYIELVEGDDFLYQMQKAHLETPVFLEALPPAIWEHRYAEGKWNVKEVLLHVIDTERIFAYRALRIARADKTPMLGFDQDEYIPFVNAKGRSVASIIEAYKAVRHATIILLKHFTDDMMIRMGTASGNVFTPLALGYIIVGHEIHHLNILSERYLISQT